MKYTRKSRAGQLVFTLSILLALSIFDAAVADDSWQVRGNFLAIDPRGDRSERQVIENLEVYTFIDHDNSLGLSAERRFKGRLGLELGLFVASPDLQVVVVDRISGEAFGAVDSLDLFSFSAGLNVHLTPNRRADVYAGPVVALISASDLNLRDSGEVQTFKIDSEIVLGAVVGVDVRIKDSRWAFNANVRYLDYSFKPAAEDGGRVDIQFDPVIVGLGASYRF